MERYGMLLREPRKQRIDFTAGKFLAAFMHLLRIISNKCKVFRKNNKVWIVRLDCLLNQIGSNLQVLCLVILGIHLNK